HRVRAPGRAPWGTDRGTAQGARLHHRLRVRPAEGNHHSHRPHGRSYGNRARATARRAGGGPDTMTQERYRVLVTDEVNPEGIAILRAEPAIEVVERPTLPPEVLLVENGGQDALVGRSATRVRREVLDDGTGVKVRG